MKGDMEIEVLKDTSDADSNAKARRRRALCVMDAGEQLRYAYDPEGAKANDNPAYPCEDYGS